MAQTAQYQNIRRNASTIFTHFINVARGTYFAVSNFII